jgi:hypothetical protein
MLLLCAMAAARNAELDSCSVQQLQWYTAMFGGCTDAIIGVDSFSVVCSYSISAACWRCFAAVLNSVSCLTV